MPTILVPVTVSPTTGNRFIARAGDFPHEAEGRTAEEAVAKLQTAAGGVTITLPETPPGGNPWLAVVGMWKDTDPELIAEWRKAIEENRQLQEEEDRLREETES